jgi:xanthine dehydrogenase accessory factor
MTPAALRATAASWLAQGRRATWVEVVSHRGSVPRETGTVMLVAVDDGAPRGIGPGDLSGTSLGATAGLTDGTTGGTTGGTTAGTIGGGHLELQAIDRARAGYTGDWSVALGPTLGQCCGGALTLGFQPLSRETLARWAPPAPRLHLQLHGAGHVGRAIVRALADLDVRVQWVDEREDEFPPGIDGPQVQRIVSDSPESEVAAAPHGACFLVMTHRHDLDERITQAILQRGDFHYLGLIGSATKRARFLHRFVTRGIPAEALSRLTCPIGLPGLSGKEPAVIAASVVAQLLLVSAGQEASARAARTTRTLA